MQKKDQKLKKIVVKWDLNGEKLREKTLIEKKMDKKGGKLIRNMEKIVKKYQKSF